MAAALGSGGHRGNGLSLVVARSEEATNCYSETIDEDANAVWKSLLGPLPRRVDLVCVYLRSSLRGVREGNAAIHAYSPRLRDFDGYRPLFRCRLEVYFCRFVGLA
jgi:hypothetical protein